MGELVMTLEPLRGNGFRAVLMLLIYRYVMSMKCPKNLQHPGTYWFLQSAQPDEIAAFRSPSTNICIYGVHNSISYDKIACTSPIY